MEMISENGVLVVVILAVIVGIVLRIKAYGGENGEAYRQRQMQGPFVPVSEHSKKNSVE